MDSGTWVRRIGEAPSQDDVLRLAQEYLVTRDPRDLALLPPDLQPPRTFTPEDLGSFSYRLAAYHGHEETARVIHRIASVIARAAVRLAELSRG